MPVIKSARKKLRKDRKMEKLNSVVKEGYRSAVKKAQKSKTPENVKLAVKLIDKATKKRLLHKNKAARLKSKLSKLAKPASKSNTLANSAAKKISKPASKKLPKKK